MRRAELRNRAFASHTAVAASSRRTPALLMTTVPAPTVLSTVPW